MNTPIHSRSVAIVKRTLESWASGRDWDLCGAQANRIISELTAAGLLRAPCPNCGGEPIDPAGNACPVCKGWG